MNNVLLRLYMYMNYKKVDLVSLTSNTICVDKDDIEYFPLSTNPIMTIKNNNSVLYFRESCLHFDYSKYVDDKVFCFPEIASRISLDNFKQKIPINIFFEYSFVSEFITQFYNIVNKDVFYSNSRHITMLLRKNNFSIWNNNVDIKYDLLVQLGIEKIDKKYYLILPLFFLYLKSYIDQYLRNDFVNHGDYESYSAIRMVTSYYMSQTLGVDSLYSKSEIIELKIKGFSTSRYGVLCERAKGLRAYDSSAIITPKLQRDLANLSLLDAICCQPDHWINNYNICVEDNMAYSVCAFDNDHPYTFSFWPFASFNRFHYKSSFIMKDGCVSLPYMDKEVVENFFKLNEKQIIDSLSHYLNSVQLWGLKNRCRQIKNSINKSIRLKRLVLLPEHAWSQETISHELSGKYGNTYLSSFAHRL